MHVDRFLELQGKTSIPVVVLVPITTYDHLWLRREKLCIERYGSYEDIPYGYRVDSLLIVDEKNKLTTAPLHEGENG